MFSMLALRRSGFVLTLSHSSQARPAPNPSPTMAGHARRLKRRTEKTTPKPRPRPERIIIDERQRSHCAHAVSQCVPYVCHWPSGERIGSGRYLFVEQSLAHGARGARDGGRDLGGFVGHGCGVAVDALESRVRGGCGGRGDGSADGGELRV
jgi:hypothetical protein